jgi:hypothetical protein
LVEQVMMTENLKIAVVKAENVGTALLRILLEA